MWAVVAMVVPMRSKPAAAFMPLPLEQSAMKSCQGIWSALRGKGPMVSAGGAVVASMRYLTRSDEFIYLFMVGGD